MTVGELIEELQKHPLHYPVFVEHPDFKNWDMTHQITPVPATDWASVADVRVDQGCSVVIDATCGIV